jgi:multiple sugar transport system permease protein
MVLPAFLMVALVTIFPILYSIWMSFNDVSLTQNGFLMKFVGIDNYSIIFGSSKYWHSLKFTILYAVVSVVVELVLGMMIAVAINGVEKLKNASIVIMLIPWSLITVVSAQMWSYIYNGVYGVLNYVFQSLHLIGAPVTWLGSDTSAVICVLVADVWKTVPFVVIILLAGLQMIPKDLYEACYMDGASRWKSFWTITFPLLRGSIALAGLFRILQAFGVFDLPFVLTGGGPGDSTESIAMLGQQVMFSSLHFGTGSAIAVSTVILVLVVCLIFLSAFKNIVSGGEK